MLMNLDVYLIHARATTSWLSFSEDLDFNTRGYLARSVMHKYRVRRSVRLNYEYQELKPSKPAWRPISVDSDSKQLEYITAIPALDSEDGHYAVACEAYMEEETQNLEE